MTRPLDGGCQIALMARAGAGLAARTNFTPFADEAAQHIGLFVVDGLDLIDAKLANFGARLGTTVSVKRTKSARSRYIDIALREDGGRKVNYIKAGFSRAKCSFNLRR